MEKHTLIVIFGITGDLATRKLLPALARLSASGKLTNVHILGVSRRNMNLPKLLASSLPDETFRKGKSELLLTTDMLQMDIGVADDYEKLANYITNLREKIQPGALQVLYYLSVPPSATLPIIEFLGIHNVQNVESKLLLEKPFGFDFESAETTIIETAKHFDESQIFRIDHYLAKEMAQNIVVFRATNTIFSNLWDKECIDAIDIIASESIGIESRAQFYEQTGALRDIVQSHLMQLLSLTLMETPNTLDWDVLPKLRALALSQLEPISLDLPGQTVVRGQYSSYREEVGNPSSNVETFVALTVFSKDPTWAGVPIRLFTGKALNKKTTEIRVYFKQKQSFASNVLTLRIQPSEGVKIDLWAKRPGYDRDFEKMNLSFDYGAQAKDIPDAYEQVIVDAIAGSKSLFASSEEILLSWKILEPVQKYWSLHTDDLRIYEAGSSIQAIMKPKE